MARLARIVIPGIPHLITQRGNRGQSVFFGEEDAEAYIGLLGEQCKRHGVEIWAYCLLPGHVHLLAVPGDEAGLGRALGETHRRYTNRVNARTGETGLIWQGRFSSFPLDEPFVLPAVHYIEMAPVMAGLCKNPAAFRWSSARAHIRGQDDRLCTAAPLLEHAPDWQGFLQKGVNISHMQKLAGHISTGRPLGDGAFIEKLENQTGRALKKRRPGRKPKRALLGTAHLGTA